MVWHNVFGIGVLRRAVVGGPFFHLQQGGGQLLSTDLLLEAQTPSAPRDGFSTLLLGRTHHNRALIGADVIHRVQQLNMRDTGDGSAEGIHNNLRRGEINDA